MKHWTFHRRSHGAPSALPTLALLGATLLLLTVFAMTGGIHR